MHASDTNLGLRRIRGELDRRNIDERVVELAVVVRKLRPPLLAPLDVHGSTCGRVQFVEWQRCESLTTSCCTFALLVGTTTDAGTGTGPR